MSVDFARIQYLFELKDTEGQSILYGDKGCVENSLENLHAIGNGFKLPYLHEIDACKVPDWVSKYGMVSRYFLRDLPMEMLD